MNVPNENDIRQLINIITLKFEKQEKFLKGVVLHLLKSEILKYIIVLNTVMVKTTENLHRRAFVTSCKLTMTPESLLL